MLRRFRGDDFSVLAEGRQGLATERFSRPTAIGNSLMSVAAVDETVDVVEYSVAINRPVRREFTYVVPDHLAEKVSPGSRVAVIFARTNEHERFSKMRRSPNARRTERSSTWDASRPASGARRASESLTGRRVRQWQPLARPRQRIVR